MPQASRGFPPLNRPTRFTFKPPECRDNRCSNRAAAEQGAPPVQQRKRTPQPAPMAMPPRSSVAQCFSAIMRRKPVDTVSTPAAPQSQGAAGDSSRVAVRPLPPRGLPRRCCARWEAEMGIGSLKCTGRPRPAGRDGCRPRMAARARQQLDRLGERHRDDGAFDHDHGRAKPASGVACGPVATNAPASAAAGASTNPVRLLKYLPSCGDDRPARLS